MATFIKEMCFFKFNSDLWQALDKLQAKTAIVSLTELCKFGTNYVYFYFLLIKYMFYITFQTCKIIAITLK